MIYNIDLNKKNDNLVIGSDPEFAVVDSEGKVVPATYFMFDLGIKPIYWNQSKEARISKEFYHPILLKDDRFKSIMDGVAFEFTLPPVSINHPEIMFENVQHGLNELNTFASKYGYKVDTKPTLLYDFHKYFEEGNELKEWCGIFGCDPDKDAILAEPANGPVVDVREHPYRYFGGHIHVSDGDKLIKDYPEVFVKLMAITVGNLCISISPYSDLEKKRAFHYGQPGRYRVQNYPNGETGVEYRTPSNYWITDKEAVTNVFKWINTAYTIFENPPTAVKVINDLLPKTIEAIKNSDQNLSKSIINSLSY